MVRNFLFHRVNSKRDPLWDPMDPVLFEKCLKYISENYTIIKIEDLLSTQLTDRHATISFDDGYKDNIQFALPLLEKYNIKASFYIVTDCIDKQIPIWTYHLEYLFKHSREKRINLDFDFLPTKFKVKELSNHSAKLRFIKKFKPFLKTLDHTKRQLILNHVIKMYHDVKLPDVMMTWKDLKHLHELGHSIGSHTSSHPLLADVTDETILLNELNGSRERIHQMLGFYPITISYPIGSYNSRVIELSKQNNYHIGVAVKQDVYIPERDSAFEIPRIELYNESWWKTRSRITTSLEKIKKVIRYK